FIYDFQNVDGATVFLQGPRDDGAGCVDGEISAAPTVDIIGRDRCINVPFVYHLAKATGGESRKTHNDSARLTCKRVGPKISCGSYVPMCRMKRTPHMRCTSL